MKALVIGSRGFLGTALIACLRRNGAEAVEASSRISGGIDPGTGLLSKEFRVPDGTRVVYYLAQSPGLHETPPRLDHLFAVNVVSAVRAATLARNVGVSKFIYTSTGNVYAPSFRMRRESDRVRRDSWYSLSKVHAEEALALAGGDMDVTIARLFGLYGPGQIGRLIPKIISKVRAGAPIVLERNPTDPDDQDGLRLSLCHVRDAAEILTALAGCTGPACVNVASDEAISIRQIAHTAANALDVAVHFDWSPTPRSLNLVADTTLLRSTLDLRFIPFAEGMTETVESILDCKLSNPPLGND